MNVHVVGKFELSDGHGSLMDLDPSALKYDYLALRQI